VIIQEKNRPLDHLTLTLSFSGLYRDINKVDATMDDIRDQMDVANEISDAISRPVGMGEELDEDDLLTELEELEQEELDAKMLETPAPAVYTPNVPTHEPGNYPTKCPKTHPLISLSPLPL
jgi:charged multivesicular body protein 4